MAKQILEPINSGLDIKYETILNLKHLIPSYDKKFDTFFVTPISPIPAVSVDWDGELWIRVTSKGEIVGLEVDNFEKVFLAKYPEVKLAWKGFKRICLDNEVKLTRKDDVCEMFLRILLNFISDLFKSHPQQPELMSA
jgi:hypothetical protein